MTALQAPIEVRFASGAVECSALLYRPGGAGRRPLVVMAHGFSATRELQLPVFAERFVAAGLGVLLFDYRHFGRSGGEPRQLLDIRRQHEDYRSAVAYARSLDWVDSDRVALFGTSFSGGHVIAVAAADPSIAAVVSQCPFTDGLASVAAMEPWNVVRSGVLGVFDALGGLLGRPPRYFPAVGAPGSVAAMTSSDAQAGLEALRPADSRWENRVAARIALAVPLYRPGKLAAKLVCPALFCVCERDSVAPAPRTLEHVSRAPRGEVLRYPIGHFDIYLGEWLDRAVTHQTEFLVRWLLSPTSR
jgi:pimeloyl-ACP methyl ester carboxylesterase